MNASFHTSMALPAQAFLQGAQALGKACSLGMLIIAAFILTGCAQTTMPTVTQNTKAFQVAEKSNIVQLASAQELAEFESNSPREYLLGYGDLLNIQVWGRTELSNKHVIGPDGKISLPLAGHVNLNGLSRESASKAIAQALRPFYRKPEVNLQVEQYVSNRVTVLGRVQNPGSILFEHQPRLLEALARAGSLPVIDKQATLTRCAIFRGREKIIWVDLKHLLTRSDPSYNIALQSNDLIYIPDSNDTSVYVLGAVARAGAYRLTPDMSVLDALSQAGGPNEDAAPQEMVIYRAKSQAIEHIGLAGLVANGRKLNFALEEGDVIYVPKSGIANAGYVLRQLLPGLSFLSFGINTASGK